MYSNRLLVGYTKTAVTILWDAFLDNCAKECSKHIFELDLGEHTVSCLRNFDILNLQNAEWVLKYYNKL